MATGAIRSAHRWTRAALAAAALCCGGAFAGERLTLEEAASRRAPDFVPAHQGETVTVQGQVALPAVHFLDYTLLGIQDAEYGLVLDVPQGDRRLDGFHAGAQLEITGEISSRAGQITILPRAIRVTGAGKAPAPQSVPVDRLQGFRYLGRLVVTEGRVVEIGDTTGGAYLLIGDSSQPYKIFLPHTESSMSTFGGYMPGDKIRVTGLALQYCPRPPHNRWFELLVDSPNQIAMLEQHSSIAPGFVAAGAVVAIAVFFLWWSRERRLRSQRETLRRTYQLGEEILGSSSVEAILRRVSEVLPHIFGISEVRLYKYNRTARALDLVDAGGRGEPVSISLASPPGGTQAGAAACYHYRTLLVIPDSARSPFPVAPSNGAPGPRALLFVPMFAQGEVVGIFEIGQNDRTRDFSADEQALAQHLGNQIGAAIRLLDQRLVQEQLFRSEKLAAVGRLISGVVNDLRAPLAAISENAERALAREPGPLEREVVAIAAESRKASAMVHRLVSFAGDEQAEARPVEINSLLHGLIEFRDGEWKARGIRVREMASREQLHVVGSQGQLEEIFLNLLVHAEQSLAEQDEKTIVVRTGLLGKRLLIEISFSGPREGPDPLADSAGGLSVCRSIITGHGGEIRLVRTRTADPRFEIELPWAPREHRTMPQQTGAPVQVQARQGTALLIEPDEQAQRTLLMMLAGRGYRVVPVGNTDVAVDLAQRLRFDTVFCSIHAPGLNWVEVSERLQARVDGFVLLSDGFDAELAADFEGEGRFVLPRPIQEQELERVLNGIQPSAARA